LPKQADSGIHPRFHKLVAPCLVVDEFSDSLDPQRQAFKVLGKGVPGSDKGVDDLDEISTARAVNHQLFRQSQLMANMIYMNLHGLELSIRER
jgi:hypothetical protein